MPAIGRTATSVSGIVPAPTISAPTGSAPAVIGMIASHPSRNVLTLRAAVTPATSSITARNPAVAHQERSTAAISNETTTSCRIARSDAVTPPRLSPSRATSATSTTGQRGSGGDRSLIHQSTHALREETGSTFWCACLFVAASASPNRAAATTSRTATPPMIAPATMSLG